ncbi:TonB family protein [Congregibacter sp.]|uniref:cell envelope integrity protein TolA n=1 Tax=Congregibacter sp. TaxID=2744308 RepID=UPI003F6CA23F
MNRDWYSLGQLTLLPVAGTLALHLLLLGAILLRFQPDSDPRTIEARVLPPTAINATLIDASSLKPKKQVRKPAPKPVAKTTPKPVKKAPAKTSTAASSSAPPKTTPKAAAKVNNKPAPAPKVEEKRISAEELAAISRRELADAMAAEDNAQVAVTAEEMSTSYAALIRDTVVNYWSRPPSARNGMEALLAIQLVPTGEIVSVSVLRSSGSVAFDRSAINAVEKAGSFPELKNLPGREFEKTFRRFQLLFRPEDLRY